MRALGAQTAYTTALMRDTFDAYADFLADYWQDPMTKRVRALLAARRESITWQRTCQANEPNAYWSYLERYPHGPHVADAGRLPHTNGCSDAHHLRNSQEWTTTYRRRCRTKWSTSSGPRSFWMSRRSGWSRRRRLRPISPGAAAAGAAEHETAGDLRGACSSSAKPALAGVSTCRLMLRRHQVHPRAHPKRGS